MQMNEKLDNIIMDKTGCSAEAACDATNAIIAELPNMIEPLVWVGFTSYPYDIVVHQGGIAEVFYHGFVDEDGNAEPDMLKGGYLTLVSMDDLKAAANSHRRDQVKLALGIK